MCGTPAGSLIRAAQPGEAAFVSRRPWLALLLWQASFRLTLSASRRASPQASGDGDHPPFCCLNYAAALHAAPSSRNAENCVSASPHPGSGLAPAKQI